MGYKVYLHVALTILTVIVTFTVAAVLCMQCNLIWLNKVAVDGFSF